MLLLSYLFLPVESSEQHPPSLSWGITATRRMGTAGLCLFPTPWGVQFPAVLYLSAAERGDRPTTACTVDFQLGEIHEESSSRFGNHRYSARSLGVLHVSHLYGQRHHQDMHDMLLRQQLHDHLLLIHHDTPERRGLTCMGIAKLPAVT